MQRKIKSINFIKIDIQGGEFFFLDGARKTINTMMPDIVIEISKSDLAKIHKTQNDLLKFMKEFGYKIFLFNRRRLSNKEITSKDSNISLSLNVFCTKR